MNLFGLRYWYEMMSTARETRLKAGFKIYLINMLDNCEQNKKIMKRSAVLLLCTLCTLQHFATGLGCASDTDCIENGPATEWRCLQSTSADAKACTLGTQYFALPLCLLF